MSNSQANEAFCFNANKRGRTDDEENDDSSSTLKRRLYDMLKEGSCTDVELLVKTDNDEIQRLHAHKTILVAMSPVIATMMTRRWGEGGQGRDVIEIPPDVGVEAVQMFLKFLYKEELKLDLNVELWLDLIYLADHYEVQVFMNLCDLKLIEKLNVENCIKIYEKSGLFQSMKCGGTAFNLLKKNLGRMLTSGSNDWMQMNANTWKAILSSKYLPNVEEIELFKGLKRWKDENMEERASDFKELIKLIRFPLVGDEDFAEFVASSRELDSDLLLEMFIYFAGKGPVPELFKNCKRRNLLEPKNSEELNEYILESQEWDIIQLVGVYSNFTIPEDKKNLTIRGKEGKEAIIKTDSFGIKIEGQYCKIEGISIVINSNDPESSGIVIEDCGNNNILDSINITGGFYGILILGSENSILNVTINNPKLVGIHIDVDSECNEVNNCSVCISDEEIKALGIYVSGKGGNEFNNLTCKNAERNEVLSSDNVINGWEISGSLENNGLTFWSNSEEDEVENNCVENIHIWGENASLNLNQGTRNTTINNVVSQNINIGGEYHKLGNGKATTISVGGEGHELSNCEAEVLQIRRWAKVQSNGCFFQLMEHSLD